MPRTSSTSGVAGRVDLKGRFAGLVVRAYARTMRDYWCVVWARVRLDGRHSCFECDVTVSGVAGRAAWTGEERHFNLWRCGNGIENVNSFGRGRKHLLM